VKEKNLHLMAITTIFSKAKHKTSVTKFRQSLAEFHLSECIPVDKTQHSNPQTLELYTDLQEH
jgi:hypothetical protein